MTKWKKILLALSVVVVVAGSLLFLFYKTQTTWVESEPYQRSSNAPASTLVVVYSRTGNTLGVAKEIANYFDADLIKIEAPQYSRDLKGQQLASKHADEEVTTTPIKYDPIDLGQYQLIFLCSPTWWFRPAPPLWSFVENHDFSNKKVFLIMTGNSRMKDERTGKFGVLVEEKNGNFLGMLFIRRGRVFWQKTPKQVNKGVLVELKEREAMW
ncbi:MAG: hypothetical protein GY779_16115 [Gammaproteobacteria bacterium]|nr:hypothetical protein [Gammaproteobacteria bacterium]